MSVGYICLAMVVTGPFLVKVLDKGILQGLVMILWIISLLVGLMILQDFATGMVMKDLRKKWDDET